MRSDSAAFNELNTASVKEPRFVVRIDFASPIFITSHAGISGVSGTVIDGALLEPSIISQRLNPIEGRSEIGSASFSVADLTGTLTDEIRSRLGAAEGLREKRAAFFLGYAGMSFSDFVLVGTQQIADATFDRGRYTINTADIQRSAKKEIFDQAQTTLSQSISATDTTINVTSTTGFTTVYHGPTYSDAANATVGYIKIKDEVIRYTGKTATSFTGCVRGVLGTVAAAYQVDAATPSSRREKVSEHIYLELPAVKMAYAILTGSLYGDAATLPASWHLGISSALVRLSDFTGIGADLWDGANAGVIIRFEGLKKVDGKKFLEEEICRLVGLFMPVYADGALGLRRAARVLSDAAGVATLDESNSTQVGELVHDMGELHNVFRVFWNWNGSDYTRTTALLDAASVSVHGRADPLDLKFKGLYGGRATDSLIYQLIDSLRDRYAAPPQRMSVTVLHSLNRLEVGDVVRVRYASVRDFAGSGASIDRAFEIQNIAVNHRTGAVQLELFGSTAPASALSPTTATTALPDGFYTAAGTALSSVATITSGVMATGTYTLAGGSDITAAPSIWYHAGDLTIPQGTTLNISGNVQLRVRGYLTLNGTINGIGGGLAGVADSASPTAEVFGNPGWVGNSRGWDGIDAQQDYSDGNARLVTRPANLTTGKHASFPYMTLSVAGSALNGLPTDLRGTGGGPGGKITSGGKADTRAQGGAGAAGGAGLLTVSRGFSTGASAVVNLSGNSSASPAMHTAGGGNKYYPGAGGAGGPGSFLLLLDGSSVSAPDLTNRFQANTGTVPAPVPYLGKLTFLDNEGPHRYSDNEDPWAGYQDPAMISAQSLAGSCLRVQFIPAPETATADTTAIPAVTGLAAVPGTLGFTLNWTMPPGLPVGTVAEVWTHTAASPFSSATKIAETSGSTLWVPRDTTATVYVWVRLRAPTETSTATYSATTPSGNGLAAVAGNLATTGLLTAQSVSVAADSAGAVGSFAGAGGSFRVFRGSTEVTSSSAYSVVSSSGVTISINPTTGVYSVSAMSADTGTATLRATHDGATVDQVYTIAKARAGVNGTNGTNGSNGSNGTNGTSAVSIALSRSAVQVFAYADGSVPSFADAEGTVTVRDGVTDVTASATLSASAGSGVTGTVNTSSGTPVAGQPKGYYRVTALANDTGVLVISAVYGGVTYTATFAVSKNRAGYEIVTALPTTNLFAGRMVYLTGDGKLYRNTAGTFASWTAVVASSDISGQITNAQIADLAAAKISGQLTDAQIAAIAAAKVTGQLADSQLAAISAAKVTGQLVASQLNIAIGGGNLLKNSGFEAGSATTAFDWIIFNGGAGDAGRVISSSLDAGMPGLIGSLCQFVQIVSATNGTDTGIIAQQTSPVIVGQTYTGSAYINPNVGGKLAVLLRFADAGGNGLGDYYSAYAPANAWTRCVVSAVAPATATQVYFMVRGVTAASESFRVDGAQLEQATQASTYAPRPDEILAGQVGTTQIADNAITTAKLVAGSVVAGKIAANAVGASEIQAGAVVAGKIGANAVTANEIAARTITAERLALGALDNLAPNGNFATGSFADWRPWYNGNEVLARDAAGVPAGAPANFVCRMFSTAGAQDASIFNCARAYYDTDAWKYGIQCRAGERFVMSVDAVSTTAAAATLYLYLYYAKTDGTYTASVYVGGVTVGASWSNLTPPSFELPADAVAFWPYVYVASTFAGGGSVYFTNLRVIRAASAELIVDGAVIADKIATNAVTAAKISAGAVTAGKIAADAVTAAEIAAGAVTASEIAAGAVVADKIAASAVTTSKLAIVAPGSALNADPAMADPSAWEVYSGAATFATVTDGKVGNTVARSTAGVQAWMNEARKVPLDAAKTYRVRCWARTVSGSGSVIYMGVDLRDSSGAVISGDGSMWYYAAAGSVPGAAWTEYSATFGAGTAKTFPSNARTMAPLFILAYGGGTSVHEIQDLRIEEVLPATLIQDGAITTGKLAADSVTANKIAAGSVTAAKLAVSTLDAISANVGTLTAGTIRNAADSFRVDVTNGRTIATTGSFMKVTGAPFGSSSQFIEWYGPYQSNLANCTEANATYYLKTNGSGYFGGALLAGVLKNSVQGTNLTSANEAILGPISTNGGNITLTLAFEFLGSDDFPGTNAGLTDYNAVAKQNPTFTVVLSRKIGGGSYSDVATFNFTGSHDKQAPIPSGAEPGYYTQNAYGSGTYTDTSGGTSQKTFKLRFTSWANVNTTVLANTLALTSVE